MYTPWWVASFWRHRVCEIRPTVLAVTVCSFGLVLASVCYGCSRTFVGEPTKTFMLYAYEGMQLLPDGMCLLAIIDADTVLIEEGFVHRDVHMKCKQLGGFQCSHKTAQLFPVCNSLTFSSLWEETLSHEQSFPTSPSPSLRQQFISFLSLRFCPILDTS